MEKDYEVQNQVPQQCVTPPQPEMSTETHETVNLDDEIIIYDEPAQPAMDQPRFEPSSEYRWARNSQPVQQPAYGRQQIPKQPKEKANISAAGVIALALCCSLLGGIIGATVAFFMDKDESNATGNPNQSNVFEGQRENTVIEIHPVDTSKQMTPAEVYAANVNSTVGITTQVTTNYWGYQTTSAASGSGFIYSDDGYILTNYHVIEDASAVYVTTYDGRSLNAKVIGYDESNDIAVLKVEAEGLTPVVIGDSSNLNVGDPVVAIGNPLGELTFSLTSGAISALEREVTFSGGITMNLIQTDCAINSGNSGGALFNLYGEVIGITNAKYSGNSNSGASIDNIGFAIPMNRVRTIVDSIVEKGYVVKPYIGVTILDVSAETQSYGLPQGASVRSIEEGGPADLSGLEINDIITHVNGEEITGAADLKKFVTESSPGDVLHLTLWRKGITMELDLTVGQQMQTGIG